MRLLGLTGPVEVATQWIGGHPDTRTPPHLRVRVDRLIWQVCDQKSWRRIGEAWFDAQRYLTPRIVTEPFPRGIRYGPAEREAVLALMDTGRLSETGRGPATSALEDAYADLVGTRHALSFNSGTASLHAALHAVEVGPERGVAAAPMTWISALTAIFQAGSYPVFCDVEPDSPNISPGSAAAVAAECAAVLATHAWGIPAQWTS